MLSASGAGGLALGTWALRPGGMSTEYIGRRTVAFFSLTSMANGGGVILFAALCPIGILQDDADSTRSRMGSTRRHSYAAHSQAY